MLGLAFPIRASHLGAVLRLSVLPLVMSLVHGCDEETSCGCEGACTEALCPTVEVHEHGYGDEGVDVRDEAALTCALEALRDGRTGRISWTSSVDTDQTRVTLNMVGDGTAYRMTTTYLDLCHTITPSVVHGLLEEPEHFEACLADDDPARRFDCLRAAVVSVIEVCQHPEETCDSV